VQIVENWSDIEGTLRTSRPSSVAPGFVTLEIELTKVKPVEGFRNLLEDAGSATVEVNTPEELARNTDLREGAIIRCRVRRAGPRNIFAHPENFSVTPG
jgi:hypothetical protein